MMNEKRQRMIYVLADFVSTNAALLLYNIFRYYLVGQYTYGSLSRFLLNRVVLTEQLLFPLLMVAIYSVGGYYKDVFTKSRVQELLGTASTALVGTAIMFFAILSNDIIAPRRMLAIELIVPLYMCLFAVVYVPRVLITSTCSRKIQRGEWAFDTLIIGTTASARDYARRISSTRNKMGLRVVGFVESDKVSQVDQVCQVNQERHDDLGLPVYPLDDLKDTCQRLGVKKLIVMPHRNGMKATVKLVNSLYALDMPILIPTDVFQMIMARPKMFNVASEPLVDITDARIPASTANLKRLSDIVVSAIALVFIAPMLAVLGIMIKLDSPGPVFYGQERVGRHKKPFTIYKLRTMHVDAEASGPSLSTGDDDPRITKIGRVLRKYRLDEFPQFWNVLKGDMSIVGPRPEREFYIKQILERAPHYTIIHQVRPGVTSWGMVKYGYASTVDEMVERLPYDILYMENVSFVIDLKIIIYTVRTVFTGKGI